MKRKDKLLVPLFVFLCILILAFPVLAQEKESNPITIDGDKISYDSESGEFSAYGNVKAQQQNMSLTADGLEGNMSTKDMHAFGNVFWQKDKDHFQGSEVFYNYNTQVGLLEKGQGTIDNYSIKTAWMEKGPSKATLLDSSFTGCTAERIKCYEIRAKKMVIYPGQKLVAYDASFYIRGKKIFTLKKYTTSLKKKKKQDEAGVPKIGYNSTNGLYLSYNHYLTISNDERDSSFIDFHYYSKSGVHLKYQADRENTKDHWTLIAGKDFDKDKLELETLPEIAWTKKTEQIPHTSLYYNLGADIGYFVQDEKNASAWRTMANVNISNAPISLSKRTTLNLGTGYQKSWYGDNNRLGVFNTSIGINQSLGQRGSTSMTYVHRKISGQTPFNFDSPGDANVLYNTFSYQVDRMWRVGISTEYNLDAKKFNDIDYTLVRNMHCFESSFTWREKRKEFRWSVDLVQF